MVSSGPTALMVIYLAGGCFWGVEEYFSRIPGVVETSVGYAQSNVPNPDYKTVCSGSTNAAETVRVVYDPDRVSLPVIIGQFFKIIDPFAINRQGNDVGSQYRTGIYYTTPGEKDALQDLLNAESARLGKPVAVELAQLQNFYPAEEYHQRYLKKNPGGYCHISFDSLADLEKPEVAKKPYQKPDADTLRRILGPQEFHVTQENGTEAPYTGIYWNNHEPGIYVDVVSGQPLFLSSDKFDSGTGWPSFSKPIERGALSEKTDLSHGMNRVEVRSSGADSHLGHVFDDGPKSLGGKRYCINSAALRFVPRKDMEKEGYGDLLKLLEPEQAQPTEK